MEADVSVIVRAKDKVGTIEATFRALRAQTRPVEIVVVDSGSTDGTVELARRWADVLIEIPPESFSYGRALNIGAAAASGTVHFSLSAHCAPSDTWVEESLGLYDDDRVAATNQANRTPSGDPLTGVYLQSAGDARCHPGWGFSNHASSWHAEVWRSIPFREDLPACEDKEWSWRVLSAGHAIAYSARVGVSMRHRRAQGPRQLYRRIAREAQAMVALGTARPLTVRDAIDAWWSAFPPGSRHSDAVRRLSPYRIVELAGAWAGGRLVDPLPQTQGPLRPYVPWHGGRPDELRCSNARVARKERSTDR